MSVSGGAVSPENRSNEEKVAALARWLDYQFESPSIGNQVRAIGAWLTEVESERDAAVAENARLLARIAAVEATLAELVRLKDGPRDDRYRAGKEAAWVRARAAIGQESAFELPDGSRWAPDSGDFDFWQCAAATDPARRQRHHSWDHKVGDIQSLVRLRESGLVSVPAGLAALAASPTQIPEEQRLATNESALTTIVRVVSETYTDAGVLLWLNAKNRHLPSKPDGNWRCTPAEYIAAGHAAEVLAAARRIEGSW